jgi:hypothetical protein
MGFKYFLPVKDELNGIFYGRNKNKITFYLTTPSIVTNGLELYLDAGDSSSYPGSGTTWYDLSGNGYNFNINASAYSTTGGIPHMNFEGSYGAAKYAAGFQDVPSTGGEGTIIIFSTILNSTSTWRTLTRGASADHQALIQSGTNNLGMYDNTSGTFIDSGFDITSLPSPYTQFNFMCWRLSSSTPYYRFQYNDNSTIYQITNSNATFDNGFYVIGATHNLSTAVGNSSQYWGKIAVFLYYDRLLSDAEVAQNYNAIKDRFAATIVTNGLVLNLDAGDSSSYPGSGTTWSDLSGNNNDATLVNGPTYTSSNSGSIVFDGTNDYATIADVTGVTDFSISDNYTVDFWVYINSTQNYTTYSDNDVVEKWSGSGGYPYVFRYLRSTQQMQVAVYNGSSSNITTLQISSNTWWHICGVFDWTNSTLTVYGNSGSSVSSTATLNLTGTITNTSALNLMRRGSGINYTTGNLSSLKIYNRALSASEVTQNYNALKDRFAATVVTSGLQLYLDAGDSSSYPGSGTTWTDLSGNGNNGTLVNGPTYSSANGGSIVFDGTNDLVTTTLTSGTSFTWCCWFKTDVLSNGYRNIISIRTNNYMLVLLDDNTNYLGFWNPDAFTSGSTLNTPQLSTNTWYFVTFVREGNNVTSGYKAYLNGSFSGSANTGTWSSSDPIILGGRTDIAQYLNGNISNVQIYNRALSASEVAQNFNALKGRYGL